MDGVHTLRRLLAYDDWANRETFSAMRAAGGGSSRGLRWMAHVVGAEWLWLGRLQGNLVPAVVWPELTLEQCEAQLPRLHAAWEAYLDSIGETDLERTIQYANSKGEPWTSTVQDVLVHVVLHSGYHRGQVAADLRGEGHEPAYTDFIHCTRSGFLD